MISYKPFRHLCVQRNVQVSDLCKELNISTATMSKLNAKKDNNDYVSLATIEKLCLYFGVGIEEIVEILFEEDKTGGNRDVI